MEDRQRLPQPGLSLRGAATGQRTAAESGQCMRLVRGAGGGASQFQGLLVTSLGEF